MSQSNTTPEPQTGDPTHNTKNYVRLQRARNVFIAATFIAALLIAGDLALLVVTGDSPPVLMHLGLAIYGIGASWYYQSQWRSYAG